MVWTPAEEGQWIYQTKDDGYGAARWRKRGRPERRLMDVVKGNMQTAGVTEGDARDRVRWTQMTNCNPHKGSRPKKKKTTHVKIVLRLKVIFNQGTGYSE